MSVPKFSSAAQSFHGELKKRINIYFKEKGKSSTGNSGLFFKAIFLLTGFIGIYIHLVFFTPPAFWAVLECLLLGGFTAGIGFNIMHDGSHGSFSKNKIWNKLASLSANLMGADNFMWKTKHNIIHHTYTNIHGVDDDIEARPLLRLCSDQKRYKIHKYQHLYFWAAYSLLYMYWVFVTDYKKYFTKKVGSMPITKMSTEEQFTFWGFKLLHAFLFVVLPIILLGFTTWIIGFLIFAMFAGFVLSIVFQLAHTVEHTEFPKVNEATGKMDDEWAIHQIKTTANFANKNKLISWLVGGLNFQIEHHLFPRISHIHYPAISKIIRQTCLEFGINYVEYPKMRLAVASHVSYLKQLGKR